MFNPFLFFCHFGVEISPVALGTWGKTQIPQKNVAPWGQCCAPGVQQLPPTKLLHQ